MKKLILVLGFVFVILLTTNISADVLCYQETANVSTNCGTDNSGLYQVLNITGETPFNLVNAIDTDYSTYSIVSQNTASNITIVYDKPENYTSATWQNRLRNSYLNYSISDSCLNYSTTNLTLIIYIACLGTPVCSDDTYLYCRNSTGDEQLGTDTGSWWYEETLIWNMTTLLNLTFSIPVNATVSGGLGYFTNVTNITEDLEKINQGITQVVFNEQSTGGSQRFTFINERRGYQLVEEYLYVIEDDFQLIEIKASEGGQGLKDVLITVQIVNGTEWQTIGQDYTNANGEVQIWGTPDKTHRVIGTKTSYTTETEDFYIPTGYSDTVVLNMQRTDSVVRISQFTSNCLPKISTNSSCSATINLNTNYTNLTLLTILNQTNFTTQCLNSYTCTTDTFDLHINSTNMTTYLYIDNILQNITHSIIYVDLRSRDIQIQWAFTDIRSDRNYLIMAYILIGIVTLFTVASIEKKKKGWGIYGGLIWLTFCAFTGFYELFFVVLPIYTLFIFRIVKNQLN